MNTLGESVLAQQLRDAQRIISSLEDMLEHSKQREADQKHLIDQLGFSLAKARSNERCLKASVEELQETVHALCRDDAGVFLKRGRRMARRYAEWQLDDIRRDLTSDPLSDQNGA